MLTMSQRKAVTRQLLTRYQRAKKKEKEQVLNEFVEVTKYNRHYTAWLLRQPWQRRKATRKRIRVSRPRVYDLEVFRAIKMLAPVKRRYQLKGGATTKPGSLLRQQIPVRTFADWDDKRPGLFEVDLVANRGESSQGGLAILAMKPRSR